MSKRIRVLVGRSHMWKLLSRGRIRSAMGRNVAVDTRSLSLRHTKEVIRLPYGLFFRT